MQPRISLVTLGVDDIARARAFYERLGWKASSTSNESVCFFQIGGMGLSLYGREALAADALSENTARGFSAITLGHNCRSKQEVDGVMEHALEAGAALKKKPQDVFWGGYSGYFADPDGHLWEVAWNPFFPLDEDGALKLPE